MELEKSLLDDFPGIILGAHLASHRPVEASAVTFEQLVKGPVVSAHVSRHQLFVATLISGGKGLNHRKRELESSEKGSERLLVA